MGHRRRVPAVAAFLMRILMANDGFGDAGGVQTYLDAVAGGLTARGHELAILYSRRYATSARRIRRGGGLPTFGGGGADLGPTMERIGQWGPELCFSHNMSTLDIDRELVARWPVVKFMHGYFGTCIGGQKRHRVSRRPAVRPSLRQCLSWRCTARATAGSCGSARSSATTGGRVSSTTCSRDIARSSSPAST